MQVESLIESIVEELKRVEGVHAIVLGGSRARGTHTSSSDIDLGIYYHPDNPLHIEQLSKVTTKLDDAHRLDVVTPIGEWARGSTEAVGLGSSPTRWTFFTGTWRK